MRVIAKSTLVRFWNQAGREDAQAPLRSWHDAVRKAAWKMPKDVKAQFAHASFCGNNRVVFNIGGNKYRLVVEVQYRCAMVWVKFIGTHARYDEIDVETVNER